MAAWTNATATAAGVLRAEELARHVDLRRAPCGAAVASWVENYWSLRWRLPHARFLSQVLPHPACSLTVERGHTRPEIVDDPVVISGVITRRFDVEIRDEGWVFGVKFRPGGLAALTGRGARAWRDRVVPAITVLPAGVVEALAVLGAETSLDRCAGVADEALAGLRPHDHARYTQLLGLITDMLADPSLITVAQLQERSGLSARALQRLFDHYVGVGPKWVLARYRLHDVLTALDAGYDGSLTDLAHRFGWYDQAHFTRVFTATTGVTPSAYRAESAPGRAGRSRSDIEEVRTGRKIRA